MAEQKHRKAINFDLDTKKLNQSGFKDTRPAYTELRKMFESLGFEHRQYSGYVSVNPLTKHQVSDITTLVSQTLPWLSKCIQRIDVTDIGKQYDLSTTVQNAPLIQQNMAAVPPKKSA